MKRTEMIGSDGFLLLDADRDERRTTIRDRIAAGLLCLATGLGAAAWSGHHALGQARQTLRATLDDPDATEGVQRAAASAVMLDVMLDIEALHGLSTDPGRPHLAQDAENYLRRISEALNRSAAEAERSTHRSPR